MDTFIADGTLVYQIVGVSGVRRLWATAEAENLAESIALALQERLNRVQAL